MSQLEVTQSTEQKWEPRILTFCCNWCSYAGADERGPARIQYAAERARHTCDVLRKNEPGVHNQRVPLWC